MAKKRLSPKTEMGKISARGGYQTLGDVGEEGKKCRRKILPGMEIDVEQKKQNNSAIKILRETGGTVSTKGKR